MPVSPMAAAALSNSLPSDSWNFSSTPGMLPFPVRQRLADELAAPGRCAALDTYHRSGGFAELRQGVLHGLRQLCGLPDGYEVLLLQGGASMQFFTLPLNMCRPGDSALYLNSGYWSQRAAAAAAGVGIEVTELPLAEGASLPLRLDADDAGYVFYVDNETADGIEFPCCPVQGCDKLVADLSSNFMSRPFSFAGHAAVFAGAQKNLGIAGLTVVILDQSRPWSLPEGMPAILDYSVQAQAGSLYNTPVLMAWHVLKLVLEWLAEQGGVEAMARLNRRKSGLLYDALDASSFYRTSVPSGLRSRVNVTFELHQEKLLPLFLEEAERAGFHGLAGHRHAGGVRAALYNAMPARGVEELVCFMREFERRHG